MLEVKGNMYVYKLVLFTLYNVYCDMYDVYFITYIQNSSTEDN